MLEICSLDLVPYFSEPVSTLIADRLPNLSKEMSLTCNEIMPPMSSSPLPSRIYPELCEPTYINDNRTEILSLTRSNHSRSRDFSSDDSVLDDDSGLLPIK